MDRNKFKEFKTFSVRLEKHAFLLINFLFMPYSSTVYFI